MTEQSVQLESSIYQAGSSCRTELSMMVNANRLRDATSTETTWPDEALARFDSMASGIGLFDSGRRAIDHRLQRNVYVRIMVRQYFAAISANARIGS